MHDAVVIGAGPNGLVAANVLADAGWSVLVLEANDDVGGAARTADITAPGFANDLCSAFYPLAAVSSVLADLELESHGLTWTHAPAVLAHPRADAPAAVLHHDVDATAAGLEADHPGDGDRYRETFAEWQRVSKPFMDSLLHAFPPVRDGLRLGRAAGLDGARELARTAVLPLQRFLEERFEGQAAGLLYAGNALHADLTPDMSGSALFGWMLMGIGQEHGFPVPVGGAGRITAALAARARARGVEIECGTTVVRVAVRGGRTTGVVTADHRVHPAAVVIADCDAVELFLRLVGAHHVPSGHLRRLRRFERAGSTFKVDWALREPVPWTDPAVGRAGTVHVAESVAELVESSAQIRRRLIPRDPFLLVGQMTTSDPTRSPAGTESMWAYTHVPQRPVGDAGDDGLTGRWTEAETDRFAARIEARLEALAPGFRGRVMARHVMAPADLERLDRNLVGGDISGGTTALHQQLVFRPVTGWARAETPVAGLFLGSASAHPGGGVHGACGYNAARATLAHRPVRRLARRLRSRSASRPERVA